MSFRRKLFFYKKPYDLEGTNETFAQAMRENCQFHYDNCKEYRQILEHFDFHPEDIKNYKDVFRIPYLPTVVFKNHHLFSMPENRMVAKATSSGTKGKFSKIGFELSGLLCAVNMVLKVVRRRKLLSLKPVNYIMMGYQPHKSNQTAVTKNARWTTLLAPPMSRSYAIKWTEEGYKVDLEGMFDAIVEKSHSLLPVRFMGFPSYTYFVMKLMESRGISVKLKPGSKILLGGGWKQFYTEQVDKETFYDLAWRVLGVPEEDVVEFFGAVEHPILYCDCKHHHFHLPIYSRVAIRDVETLEPLGMDQVGLVNLMTPMVKATPILSIMTDDLGVIRDGSQCGCGITSPYLEIIGRVGMKDIKTCAAGAADLMPEVTKV